MKAMEASLKEQLLELIVEKLSPEFDAFNSSDSMYFNVITKFVMDMIPLDDINLSPFLRDSLRRGQSSLAMVLLKKGGSVHELGPCYGFLFTERSHEAFKKLLSSGYQFPDVNTLKSRLKPSIGYEVEFEAFCDLLPKPVADSVPDPVPDSDSDTVLESESDTDIQSELESESESETCHPISISRVCGKENIEKDKRLVIILTRLSEKEIGCNSGASPIRSESLTENRKILQNICLQK
jgi:hypothetical protein